MSFAFRSSSPAISLAEKAKPPDVKTLHLSVAKRIADCRKLSVPGVDSYNCFAYNILPSKGKL